MWLSYIRYNLFVIKLYVVNYYNRNVLNYEKEQCSLLHFIIFFQIYNVPSKKNIAVAIWLW